MKGITILVFCLFGCPTLLNGQLECSLSNINVCLQSIKNFGLVPDPPESVLMFPRYTQEYWTKNVCPSQALAFECVKKLVNCVTLTELTYRGLDNAIDYLCTSGFTSFFPNIDCINNVTVNSLTCVADFATSLQFSSALFDVCKLTKNVIGCQAKAVGESCGGSAESFMRTFDTLRNQPVMGLIGCDLSGCTSNMFVGNTLYFVLVTLIAKVMFS